MIKSERHIEMLWRCSSCGHKNLGRYKTCQSCANPKDASEKYEMPPDPSQAATVTDEALLRMATSGPNWRCAYCGSDQRRLDMGCGNCGASAVEGRDATEASTESSAGSDEPAPQVKSFTASYLLMGVPAFILLCMGIAAFVSWNRNRPRDYQAVVSAAHWERDIAVERYQIKAHEGFKDNMPADAFEIRSIGKRVHHHEQVLDGYDTEHYSVEVPDGTRTETYTEHVACGQDCTTTPETCSEQCSSNNNGFATCRNVCSGGGQSCTTRYCDETRTREVPKTRTEQRTREVPRYRSEPRYAPGFAYKRWEWLPARKVHAEGTATPVTWPEANLGKDLGSGEKEREQRSESYKVTLSYDRGKRSLDFAPTSEADFARYPRNSEHKLHTEHGRYQLDGEPLTPTRAE